MVPKLKCAATRSRCPRTSALPGARLVRRGGQAKGRHRPSGAARTKARSAQHVRAYLRKAPGCAQRRGAGKLQKLSHMPFHSPHRPLLSPDPCSPLHRSSWRGSGLAEAGGGARAAGVTCRESFQLLGAVTHPQGRASGRGQLSAPQLPLLRLPRRPLLLQQPLLRLRSGPSPRLAHRGLIGSANPRPWACSRRHLPLARPPGPRLPRPFPPRAAAAPGTSGTRRANFLQGL